MQNLPPMAWHYVARAVPGRLLARNATEALALWEMLVRTFPELIAACVMPDHIHVLLPRGHAEKRLSQLMSAWARSRFHAGGGRLWERPPPPDVVVGRDKVRRHIRYIHLNPCAAKLVACPLAWPFSTHRDHVGMAARPVVPPHRDPAWFHRYVSSDDRVDRAGTPLPRLEERPATWSEVLSAVESVCRVGPEALTRRGPARTLASRTAWRVGLRGASNPLGLGRTQRFVTARGVAEGGPHADPALAACLRALGDDRFAGLPQFEALRGWWLYEGRR